jgi:hypothetical protein
MDISYTKEIVCQALTFFFFQEDFEEFSPLH